MTPQRHNNSHCDCASEIRSTSPACDRLGLLLPGSRTDDFTAGHAGIKVNELGHFAKAVEDWIVGTIDLEDESERSVPG